MLFEGDLAEWYVAVGEQRIGPLSAWDLYEKIVSQEITFAHYAWKKGFPQWKRICEIPAFESLVPKQPSKTQAPALDRATASSQKAIPPRFPSERVWFLYHQDTQFGPFAVQEIQSFLQSGKIHLGVYAWREGMKGWEVLSKIEAFQSQAHVVPPGPPARSSTLRQKSDQRKHPRQPLIAKIHMANETAVITGVCRDISIGGLQVLTDTLPGEVGSRLKMNISPSGQSQKLDALVAEGEIVRILEDGRGFSFRFGKISEKTRRAIQQYIESSD